jgi:Transposase DDE domain group 1
VQVNATAPLSRIEVACDMPSLTSRAGSALLTGLADASGLTDALVSGLTVHSRAVRNEPGRVARDLAVMLADGGDALTDLGALRDQPTLFGHVASDPTAYRCVERLDAGLLAHIRDARAAARTRAWGLAKAPRRVVLDIDATLLTAHSEKERAAGTYKGGYGFHPLLCFEAGTGEALSGILRPGNAGSNTAADHVAVLERALAQLPQGAAGPGTLVRCDSAGATHDFLAAVLARGLAFSVGRDLSERVRAACLAVRQEAWLPALDSEGDPHDGAWVAALDLDLSAWPEGTRAICRRERPHPGAQLSFSDADGHRFQVLLTNLPFRSSAMNAAWLELVLTAVDLLSWTRRLLLAGTALAACEPKRLRYRLLHVAGRIARHARGARLRLPRSWPWAQTLAAAFARLQALPSG